MKRSLRCAFALTLIFAMPLASLAQQHRGGGGSGGGSHTNSAPPPPAPARPSAPSGGGFDLHRDIAPPAPHVAPPVVHYAPAAPHYAPPTVTHNAPPTVTHNVPPTVTHNAPQGNSRNANVPNRRTPSFTVNTYGPYNGQFHGSHLRNDHYNQQAWGWNRGEVWQPAYSYWGGGFWGAFALVALDTLVSYGEFYDSANNYYYPSYQVFAGSPGAQMLQDYGLTQTQCGPPNLVVIWGPDNSVICAYPNDEVSPGNYQLDPSTLTLVSQQ